MSTLRDEDEVLIVLGKDCVVYEIPSADLNAKYAAQVKPEKYAKLEGLLQKAGSRAVGGFFCAHQVYARSDGAV